MLSDPKSPERVRLRRSFKGLNIVRSRHDRTKVFIYHTKSGRPLTADPIKEPALFREQYEAAQRGEPAPGEKAKAKGTVAQGTWNAAIDLWLATQKYLRLADNTKRIYRPLIDALRSGLGSKLMRHTTPWDVRELHDDVLAIKKANQANSFFSVLKHIAAVGRFKGWVPANVDLLAAIELQEVEHVSYRAHQDIEIAAWRATHADEDMMARKAFELAYRLGLATSDLIRFAPCHINADGDIDVRRKKTQGEQLSNIHNDPELRAILESFDRTGKAADVPFLSNQWGDPFQPSAFRKQWRRWAEEAGLPSDFKIHGARATMVVDMMDNGVASIDGMKLTGHSDQRVYERIYGKGHSKKLARDRAQIGLVAARSRKAGKPALRVVA